MVSGRAEFWPSDSGISPNSLGQPKDWSNVRETGTRRVEAAWGLPGLVVLCSASEKQILGHSSHLSTQKSNG
jgi:hypothetical protein